MERRPEGEVVTWPKKFVFSLRAINQIYFAGASLSLSLSLPVKKETPGKKELGNS